MLRRLPLRVGVVHPDHLQLADAARVGVESDVTAACFAKPPYAEFTVIVRSGATSRSSEHRE